MYRLGLHLYVSDTHMNVVTQFITTDDCDNFLFTVALCMVSKLCIDLLFIRCICVTESVYATVNLSIHPSVYDVGVP